MITFAQQSVGQNQGRSQTHQLQTAQRTEGFSRQFAVLGGIVMELVEEPDGWLAIEHTTGVFGEADEFYDAAADLRSRLEELKAALQEDRERLDPLMLERLLFLESKLGR